MNCLITVFITTVLLEMQKVYHRQHEVESRFDRVHKTNFFSAVKGCLHRMLILYAGVLEAALSI